MFLAEESAECGVYGVFGAEYAADEYDAVVADALW